MEQSNGADGPLILPRKPHLSFGNYSQLLHQKLGSCNDFGAGGEPSMVKSNIYGAYSGVQSGQFPLVMPYMPPVVMPFTNMAGPGLSYQGMLYANPHMETQHPNMLGLKQHCTSCGAWKPEGHREKCGMHI